MFHYDILLWVSVRKMINNHIQAYRVKFQHIPCVIVANQPHDLCVFVVDFYTMKG